MNVRMLVNVGLLLLVLGLALLAWLEPGLEPEAEPPRLTALAADAVTRLSIRLPRGDDVVLEKEGGEWMMTSPVRAYANAFRIDPLLRVVEAASHARFPAAGRDLTEYRLDPPLAVLRADGEAIAFGGTEPIDHRRYVQVGDTIHLIEDHYYYRLQTDYPAFVSNRLLPPAGRPRALALPGLSLARDEEGRWTASPSGGLTPDAINELVDEWARAQALEIEPYAAAGETPHAGVRVELDGDPGGEIVFGLVERGAGLALARADLGLLYRLTEEQAARLLPETPVQDAPPER